MHKIVFLWQKRMLLDSVVKFFSQNHYAKSNMLVFRGFLQRQSCVRYEKSSCNCEVVNHAKNMQSSFFQEKFSSPTVSFHIVSTVHSYIAYYYQKELAYTKNKKEKKKKCRTIIKKKKKKCLQQAKSLAPLSTLIAKWISLNNLNIDLLCEMKKFKFFI